MKKTQSIARPQNLKHVQRRDEVAGWLFAAPWIIGFLIFSLYPIVISIYYSLTEFNIFQSPKWVGLQNFINLFHDDKFYKSLGNTFYMVIIATPIGLVVALLLAVLLNQKMTPQMLASAENRQKLEALIRTFFNTLHGYHVQYNIVSRETLIDAQLHPEDHKDLIVRVAGYSAFFNVLSKQTQDDIIARTEQTL